MIWPVISLPLLATIALPWLLEARRKTITDTIRREAPGQFASLSRGRTHYAWAGPEGTRVVVLVHGLSSPSWVFSGLTRGLVGAGYRVLSYDLYGRGYSDRPSGAQTLDFHTGQLRELLDALGLHIPVTLLGFSMGGAIATQFTADHPDRVERLILLATAGLGYTPGRLLATARAWRPFGDWLWGVFGGRILTRAAARDAKAPTVIPDLPQRIRAELGRRGYLPAILSSERHTLSRSMSAAHAEVAAMQVPTLAIWGEADPVIPIAAMGDLALLNRRAHQAVIPGAGHGLAYANPKQVLDAIREFLRDIPD